MSGFQFIPAGSFDVQALQAKNRADEAFAKARGAVDELSDLRAQVDRLQMICEAMWSIIKDRLGAGEEELLRLIEEIDLRDGRRDGRAAPKPVNCAMCGRAVSVRTMVCLYCGAKNEKSTVF